MSDPEILAIREIIAKRVPSNNIAQRRRDIDARGLQCKLPADARVEPVNANGVKAEWSATADADPAKVVLYLHGGGYVIGSLDSHRHLVVEVGRAARARTLAIDYRMAPEHLFPAAVDDAVAAYRALREQTPGKIVVAGDSAGGGLALAMLISLRDSGAPLPAAVALFSPWTDLAGTGDSLRTNDGRCAMFRGANISKGARFYLGDADPRNPLASPLYADLAGLPPMLIHVGKDETLLDDSTRLADRARAAGVRIEMTIWPVVPHVWQLIPAMPEARRSLREAARFLLEG